LSKYNNRYEYITEKLSSWLVDFADSEAEKIAKQNNLNVEDIKSAGYMDSITNIMNRKKINSVEGKVQDYREAVGLDLVSNIEKSGEQDASKEVLAALSIRDKIAKEEQSDVIETNEISNEDKEKLEDIKKFVSKLIENRNGSIATQAILEQIKEFVIDEDETWMLDHDGEIEAAIKGAKEKFTPKSYGDISIDELTKTDGQSKNEAPEERLFQAPKKEST